MIDKASRVPAAPPLAFESAVRIEVALMSTVPTGALSVALRASASTRPVIDVSESPPVTAPPMLTEAARRRQGLDRLRGASPRR